MIVARSRNGAWIGRTGILAAGETLTVEMAPAATVEVRLRGWHPGAVVAGQHAGGEVVRMFRASLCDSPWGRMPVARAVLAVPRGPLRLQAWNGGGLAIADRHVEVAAPWVAIDL